MIISFLISVGSQYQEQSGAIVKEPAARQGFRGKRKNHQTKNPAQFRAFWSKRYTSLCPNPWYSPVFQSFLIGIISHFSIHLDSVGFIRIHSLCCSLLAPSSFFLVISCPVAPKPIHFCLPFQRLMLFSPPLFTFPLWYFFHSNFALEPFH